MEMKGKIVVWKDESFKLVKDGITWEYEQDSDWFTTIDLGLVALDLSLGKTERFHKLNL